MNNNITHKHHLNIKKTNKKLQNYHHLTLEGKKYKLSKLTISLLILCLLSNSSASLLLSILACIFSGEYNLLAQEASISALRALEREERGWDFFFIVITNFINEREEFYYLKIPNND